MNVFVGMAETESSQNTPLVLLVKDNRAEWSVDLADNTSDCLLHAPLVSKLDQKKNLNRAIPDDNALFIQGYSPPSNITTVSFLNVH